MLVNSTHLRTDAVLKLVCDSLNKVLIILFRFEFLIFNTIKQITRGGGKMTLYKAGSFFYALELIF